MSPLTELLPLLLLWSATTLSTAIPFAAHHEGEKDGCDPGVYRVLDDPRRVATHRLRPGQQPLCDDLLPVGWYRFMDYGVSLEMSTSCPPADSCGSRAQVWLDLPLVDDILTSGNLSTQACVSWGFSAADRGLNGEGDFALADCCLFTLSVDVRNCGGFNVYRLGPTQACDIAYCAAPINGSLNEIPVATKVALRQPTIEVGIAKNEWTFTCKADCGACRFLWYLIPKDGEARDEIVGLDSETVTETQLQLLWGDEVQCEVFLPSAPSSTVASEPVKTGFEWLNGDSRSVLPIESVTNMTITQHLRLPCQGKCRINADVVDEGGNLAFGADCRTTFENCDGVGVSDVRCSRTFNISVRRIHKLPDRDSHNSGKIQLQITSSQAIRPGQILEISYSVLSLPSRQCHLHGLGRVVDFGEAKIKDIHDAGPLLLLQTDDFQVQAFVQNKKFANGHDISVPCAISAKEEINGLWTAFHLDICSRNMGNSIILFNSNTGNAAISSYRGGHILFVDFPSGRFLRINLPATFDEILGLNEAGMNLEKDIYSSMLSLTIYEAGFRPHSSLEGLCSDGSTYHHNRNKMRSNMFSLDYLKSTFNEIGDSLPKKQFKCQCHNINQLDHDCDGPEATPRHRFIGLSRDVTRIIPSKYPTTATLPAREIFIDATAEGNVREALDCEDALLNSTLASECGRFYDRDVMAAIHLCQIDELSLSSAGISSSSPLSGVDSALLLMETQCAAALDRKGVAEVSDELTTVLACHPEGCGAGRCQGELGMCRCNDGSERLKCVEDSDEGAEEEEKLRLEGFVGLNQDAEGRFFCNVNPEANDELCTNLRPSGRGLRNVTGKCVIHRREINRDEKVGEAKIGPQGTCWTDQSLTEFASRSVEPVILNISIEASDGKKSNNLQILAYDSRCINCQPSTICMPVKNTCRFMGKCYLSGEKRVDDPCLICSSDGVWTPPPHDEKPVKTDVKHLTMLDGARFNYDLGSFDFDFAEILSAPPFTRLERGRFVAFDTNGENALTVMNVLLELTKRGECDAIGQRLLLELQVEVLECPCRNGGKCAGQNGDCICSVNFSGEFCETVLNACFEHKCQSGRCVEDKTHSLGYSCQCHPGFTGTFCDTVANLCNKKPCYEGVECIPAQNAYFCGPCPAGMTGNGIDCSIIESSSISSATTASAIEADPCSSSPCFRNVSCFAIGRHAFLCGNCPAGMTGDGIYCSSLFAEDNLCAHAATNPCFAPSLCRLDAVTGAATCSACPRGMKGDGVTCVSVWRDPCAAAANPCHAGAACAAVNGLATCGPCPEGMSGDGKVCHRLDPCQMRKPCAPDVDCVVDAAADAGFRCGPCPSGTSGNGTHCAKLRWLSPCLPNPCHEDVACEEDLDDEKGFKCGPCPEDMTGDGQSCKPIDPCSSNPCFPGVTCLAMTTREFECGLCPHGYVGDGIKCDLEMKELEVVRNPLLVDPCSPNPCFPGVQCVAIWKGDEARFSCGLCPDGMIGNGRFCSSTDPCSPDPCPHGLSCVASSGTFSCTDEGDESLVLSQQESDHCDPNPCYEGVKCTLTGNGTFRCGECPPGTLGEDGIECRIDNRTLISCPFGKKCFPGVSKCFLTIGSRFQTVVGPEDVICGPCPEGYRTDEREWCRPICRNKCSVGYWCSAPDTCSALCRPPCANGGKCQNNGTCKCPPGFSGQFCQTKAGSNDNESSPHQPRSPKWWRWSLGHDARTNEIGTRWRYYQGGSRSPLAIARCKRRCQNGGVCVAGNRCRCRDGYRGRFCHKPKCPGGCKNGGTCVAPYRCQCWGRYTGKSCKSISCDPPCENGGKCRRDGRRCKCRTGFFGHRCQHRKKQ